MGVEPSPRLGQGNGVRLLRYPVPNNQPESLGHELIDESLHALHNFLVVNFDSDPSDELFTASLEGVYLLDRGESGKWKKTLLGEGNDEQESPPEQGKSSWESSKAANAILQRSSPGTGIRLLSMSSLPNQAQSGREEFWMPSSNRVMH